jgi:hypothetical protein
MRLAEQTKNILRVYAKANADEVAHGKQWYALAKQASQTIADKHELPLRIVVGVVAALSPTNKWERNLVDADNMCGTFVTGGYVEDTAPCTYKTMRDKAWRILQEKPDSLDDIAAILKGPKITDFFWCIMGEDTCVIDGHAWCIANNDRRTMQEVPSIGVKLRKQLQQAYVNAGSRYGMTAYEMQAATWVAWRRLHNIA